MQLYQTFFNKLTLLKSIARAMKVGSGRPNNNSGCRRKNRGIYHFSPPFEMHDVENPCMLVEIIELQDPVYIDTLNFLAQL